MGWGGDGKFGACNAWDWTDRTFTSVQVTIPQVSSLLYFHLEITLLNSLSLLYMKKLHVFCVVPGVFILGLLAQLRTARIEKV